MNKMFAIMINGIMGARPKGNIPLAKATKLGKKLMITAVFISKLITVIINTALTIVPVIN